MTKLSIHETMVKVAAGDVSLDGVLAVPRDAHGIVLFAHGSGSSRHSPRNQFVAETLNEANLGSLFGSSTGAGAALLAAGHRPERVRAVVSRGGRPDLAGPTLAQVESPTLLIVGARDRQVIELNRLALEELRCEKKMEILPRATHLFEEPGALEEVGRLAADWFVSHLSRVPVRI